MRKIKVGMKVYHPDHNVFGTIVKRYISKKDGLLVVSIDFQDGDCDCEYDKKTLLEENIDFKINEYNKDFDKLINEE